MAIEGPRVLSIQSHVVFGYVGNKSATFPLQTLGFDVDPINSVQFCNHTGYKKVTGQVLSDKDLSDLVEGLEVNNLDYYSHLLTGYIGNPTFLNRIATLVKHLKKINPNLVYVCDPVMGDNGRMYVPKELLPIYKDVILQHVDIITPNQFEAEILTDQKITSVDDAKKAIEILHKKGCKIVVLSSTELGDKDKLFLIASSKDGIKSNMVKLEIPKLDASFTGSGDLFASLFLAWMYKSNGDIKTSIEKVIASIQAVLKRTLEHAKAVGISCRTMELKIIQSKSDIENPKVEIFATNV